MFSETILLALCVFSSKLGFNQARTFWNEPSDIPEPIDESVLVQKIESLAPQNGFYLLFGTAWCAESRNLLISSAKILGDSVYFVDIEKSKNLTLDLGLETIPVLTHWQKLGADIKVKEYLGPSLDEHIYYWMHQIEQKSDIPTLPKSIVLEQLAGADPVTLHCCSEIAKQFGNPPLDLIVVNGITSCTSCTVDWRGTRFAPSVNFTSWESLIEHSREPHRLDSRNAHWANLLSRINVLIAMFPPTLSADHARLHDRLTSILNLVSKPVLAYETGMETPFERRFAEFMGFGSLLDANTSRFETIPTLLMLRATRIAVPKYSTAGSIVGSQTLNFANDGLRSKLKYIYPHNWVDQPDESIINWIEDVQLDRLHPMLVRNEPRPYKFNQGTALMEVNGEFLQQTLNHPDVDAVIFVYAPWCTHCKLVLHHFKQCAERFSSTDIAFLTFNAGSNDIPALSLDGNWRLPLISGFPTIWIKSKSLDSVVEYVSERSEMALTEFLRRIFNL